MAIRQRLMGAGLAALAAQNVAGNATKGISAAGTTQATAQAVYDEVNVISVCASGAGVILRGDLGPGDEQLVANYQATNACLVYPPVGGTIDNATANTGFSVAANKAAIFRCIDGLNFISILSN